MQHAVYMEASIRITFGTQLGVELAQLPALALGVHAQGDGGTRGQRGQVQVERGETLALATERSGFIGRDIEVAVADVVQVIVGGRNNACVGHGNSRL